MSKVLKWDDTIVICGVKGTGKTEWLRWFISQLPRPFVVDPMEEFTEFENRYVPQTDRPEELERVAKKLWDIGNVTLVVDEAELYLPNKLFVPPATFKIITRGRDRPTHAGVGLVVCTRRIANLNKTVFGLSNHIIIFRHFGVNDIKYLGEFVPEADQLRTIHDYHWWHWHWTGMDKHNPIPLVKREIEPTEVKGQEIEPPETPEVVEEVEAND